MGDPAETIKKGAATSFRNCTNVPRIVRDRLCNRGIRGCSFGFPQNRQESRGFDRSRGVVRISVFGVQLHFRV